MKAELRNSLYVIDTASKALAQINEVGYAKTFKGE